MIKVRVQLERGAFTLDAAFESSAPVLGVFGPSGAGKSTLINAIAGLEIPNGGAIDVNGTTLFDSVRRINLPTHKRRVGVVFQEHRLFPHYSVRGNLLYGARNGDEKLASIVALLELQPLLGRQIRDLSGGERQRVALGRALLSEPSVLLLDEPLASLDHRLRQQVLPYLRRLHEVLHVPIVYVSHELDEILQLTNELLLLEGGRVAGIGAYNELVHQDAALHVVHDRGMTNILHGRVAAHRAEEGVSVVTVGSASVIVPRVNAAEGNEVSLSIQPWDIALASHPIAGVSIQNQLPATVQRTSMHENRVLVEVDIGVPIIVEVSKRSALAMNLQPAVPVVCLIKSHAIRCATE